MVISTANPGLATQLAQAIPLALAACFYPPVVIVLIYYLSRDSARRLLLAFYAGAFAMTLTVGVVGILLLDGAGVDPRSHPTPSATVDIALGALMLLAARILAHRTSRPPKEQDPSKRRTASVRGALLLGIVMYTPSLFYIAAMKTVGDADPGPVGAFVSALIITICVLAFIELPILLYLLFPAKTEAKLKSFNEWIHRRGRTFLVWGFRLAGLYLLARGVFKLLH